MSRYNVRDPVVSGNRFEWTIPNYFSMSLELDMIYSKDFYFKSESFYFVLFPKGLTYEGTEDWMGIRLYSHNSRDWSEYTAHFSIRKRSREQTNKSTEISCVKLDWNSWKDDRLLPWVTLIQNKDELVPDGRLTILCSLQKDGDEPVEEKSRLNKAVQVSFNEPTSDAAVQTIEEATVSSLTSELKDFVPLPDEFEAMYETGDFCDFDVKVQDRVFRTHKVVLAARSPAFASMLHHDMKEKKTGMVEIVDCDSDTFEVFLKFLYGGKKDIIVPKNVVGLFEVASKYDVQNLKAECYRFMMENLSTELFCDVLCLALKHDERELIKQATEYFKQNKKNIFLSVKWQIFLKENSTYGNELLIKTCD